MLLSHEFLKSRVYDVRSLLYYIFLGKYYLLFTLSSYVTLITQRGIVE